MINNKRINKYPLYNYPKILIFLFFFITTSTINFLNPSSITTFHTGSINIHLQFHPPPLPDHDYYNNHSLFLNFDNSLKLWISFDDNDVYNDNYEIGIYDEKIQRGKGCWIKGINNGKVIEVNDMENIGNDMSVSMWININEKDVKMNPQDRNHNILSIWNDGGWLIRVNGNTGMLSTYGIEDNSGFNYNKIDSGFIIEWEKTYHIVFQIEEIDNTNSRTKVFVNGVEINNTPLGYHVGGVDNGLLKIGKWGNYESMDGYIDEIMIFNRVITDNEVKSLYNANVYNDIQVQFNNLPITDILYYACSINSEGVIDCSENRGLSDGIDPVFINVTVLSNNHHVYTISWETDVKTSCLFTYELDSPLELIDSVETIESLGYLIQHTVVLRQLHRNGRYKFNITCKDFSQTKVAFKDVFLVDSEFDFLPTPQQIEIKEDIGLIKIDSTWEIVTKSQNFATQYLQDKISDIVSLEISSFTYGKNKKKIIVETAKKYVKRVSSLKKVGNQGYYFEVFVDSIKIIGNSDQACFYGVLTFIQAIRHDSTIEAFKIVDWPDLEYRGIVDMGKLPSSFSEIDSTDSKVFSQEQKDYIDFLASMKYNIMFFNEPDGNFYMEDDESYFNGYVALQQYLRERHIEMIVNVGTAKKIYGLPIELMEGWWFQNEHFQFGNDEYAYAENPFENILVNGNFETGDITGWEECSGVSYTIHSTQDNVKEGSYSLEIHNNNCLKQNIYLDESEIGKTYYFSHWVKGGYKAVGMKLYDKENKFLRRSMTSKYVPYSDWTFLASAITIKNGTYLLQVLLMGGNNMIVDNCTLFRADGSLLNVIRSDNTDIEVFNSDKTVQYEENKDYIIENGDLSHIFNENLKPYKIKRIQSGAITSNERVLVSYDCRINYRRSNYYIQPPCLSDPNLYEDYFYKGVDRVMKKLNPNFIHLLSDEIRGFNRDSRNIKRGISNEDLLAEYFNKMGNYIKSKKKSCKILLWNDMLTPYHNGYDSYQNNFQGSDGELKNVIEKNLINSEDFIIDIWYYYDQYFTNMIGDVNYFNKYGFSFFGSPGSDRDTIKFWSEILVDRDGSKGLFATWWSEGSIDETFIASAEHSWNTKYKNIYFDSFEVDYFNQSDDFYNRWDIFQDNTPVLEESDVLQCNGLYSEVVTNEINICGLKLDNNYCVRSSFLKNSEYIEGNKEYIISASINIKDSPTPTENPSIGFEFFDQNYQLLNSTIQVIDKNMISNIFHTFTSTKLSPNDTNSIKIILCGGINDKLSFDSIYLKVKYHQYPTYIKPNYQITTFIIIITSILLFSIITCCIMIVVCCFIYKKKRKDKINEVELKPLQFKKQ